MLRAVLIQFALVFAFATGAWAQAPGIEDFVDPPSVWSGTLSPSGRQIASIREIGDAQALSVLDTETGRSRLVQHLPKVSGVLQWVRWKGEDTLVFGLVAYVRRNGVIIRDADLDPDIQQHAVSRVFSVPAEGGQVTQMFESQVHRFGGSMYMMDSLPAEPDHVLMYAWDETGAGLWRANVRDGRVTRAANGTWTTLGYATDGVGYPVISLEATASGLTIMRRASGAQDWISMMEVRRSAMTTNSPDFDIVGAGPGPNQVYVLARPEGQDLMALYLFDASTGAMGEPLQTGVQADLSGMWVHPQTRALIATCETYQYLRCTARERSVQRHLDAVSAYFDNKAVVALSSMSNDGMVWLLSVESPELPGAYYLYNRRDASLTSVFNDMGGVAAESLAPIEVVNYASRDGTPLWAYVTARPSGDARPMVVLPHGGPEARDHYEYDRFAQFLASRGYVVLQPNFRGSLGFGRAFADAGRGQWGKRMQDDVTDAVQHMIDTGVADPERICIVGISYGGYAALAGAALTPDLYQCAASIAGVSDLIDMLREERRDTRRPSASYHYWRRSIGDPLADRAALIAASPARQAERIQIPILLLHGEDDGIVPESQSQTMERALRAAGKDVRYQSYEEEGHPWGGWERENEIAVFREVETFLAQHLPQ